MIINTILLLSLIGNTQTGLASRYRDPGDRYENFSQPMACEKKLRKILGLKAWRYVLELGVAHRTLPCGKRIVICRPHPTSPPTCTNAFVIDRGPYGALNQQGIWHRRSKLQPGERWRGIVDLLPPVAAKLGVWGLEKVVIWY